MQSFDQEARLSDPWARPPGLNQGVRAKSYAGSSTPWHPGSDRPTISRGQTGLQTHLQGTSRPISLFVAPSSIEDGARQGYGAPRLSRSSSAAVLLTVPDEGSEQGWRANASGDTPLERSIDAIGMGRYQWALLALTGTGWACDNLWMQAIAIVLPHVQKDFEVADRYIGLMSSSTFAGMMVGALGWGNFSDIAGRRAAFNGTLILVAVFGLLSARAGSFAFLCVSQGVGHWNAAKKKG